MDWTAGDARDFLRFLQCRANLNISQISPSPIRIGVSMVKTFVRLSMILFSIEIPAFSNILFELLASFFSRALMAGTVALSEDCAPVPASFVASLAASSARSFPAMSE